jgi:hypothetical protein
MTRALAMLTASAAAGALLWAASRVHRDTTAGYWAEIGILAVAGLVVAIGRLAGSGVTGRIRIAFAALTFGFLPALVAGGWMLLASQPNGSSLQHHILAWSGDIHVSSVVQTLVVYAPVIAFGLGLLLGLVFERAAAQVAHADVAQPVQPQPVQPQPETTSIESRRVPGPSEGRRASTA